jgi:hypothetical protein
MHVSRRRLPTLAGVLFSLFFLFSLSGSALAAPIIVNLRVEGSTQTLFEGPVSTEAILPPGIATTSSSTPEPCDVADNGSNGGFGASAANPTSALYEAALASHLAFNAEWFTSLHDFEVTQVGTDINGGETEGFPSWGYAVNYTTAEVGGCQIRLAPGSEVLWAYNFFGLPHLLSLTGPTSVTPGTPFIVHVTDGQTGEPISGAAIGQFVGGVTSTAASSPTTDAAGNATVTLAQIGTATFKATRSDAVRSNGLSVSVVANGACACAYKGLGTTTPSPPPSNDVAKIAGLSNGRVYSRRSAPHVLRGVVDVPAGGTLRQVRISLQRRFRGRCFDFSGSRESFVRTKKCGSASFFSVGGSESFSYLLPARLPKGRYVFDIEGVDSTGQATKLVSGVSHVVFTVK